MDAQGFLEAAQNKQRASKCNIIHASHLGHISHLVVCSSHLLIIASWQCWWPAAVVSYDVAHTGQYGYQETGNLFYREFLCCLLVSDSSYVLGISDP